MFYDIDDNIKDNYRFDLDSGQQKSMFLKIDCVAGKRLMASTSERLSIEGRHQLDSSYVDMETVGIDMTPFAGTTQTYIFRFTCSAITTYKLEEFFFYFNET